MITFPRDSRSSWSMRLLTGSAGLALTAGVNVAAATTFTLTPRDLGDGYSFAGSITTDGTLGALSAANITDWRIRVDQVTDTFFTPANTSNNSSLLSVSGGQLLVPTSPDGALDGGSLAFGGGRRFGVRVADFSGENAATGGQAYYVNGGSFDAQPLGQPLGTNYVAAIGDPTASGTFNLVPLSFPGGVKLTGTLKSDGLTGPAHLVDWNVRLREATHWSFNPGNTQVLSDFGLATDGHTLTVTPFDVDENPGSFVIGAFRFDLTGVILADFTTDGTGQAGYVSPFVYQTINGLPLDAAGRVVIAQAVPEPSTWGLMGVGLLLTALRLGRRGRGRDQRNGGVDVA